jgi:tetratricopeptide (TPR) repeat protein
MDALQFGKWLGDRRRKCGWRSQRAFVEAVREDAFLQDYAISEDFLGRLEAGLLAHPFRGMVRRRVLALSWLLCKTPRDVRTYLQAAELGELSAEEAEYVRLLNDYVAARQTAAPLLLPPRPAHLFGRTLLLDECVRACTTIEGGICALTGMPGVGKSALAAETLAVLAANERERLRLFPDGMATFTCTGRRGKIGLIALCDEIVAVFSRAGKIASRSSRASEQSQQIDTVADDLELAAALDRVRRAMAGKRALLLLEDLDEQFPLRQACDVLFTYGQAQHSSAEDDETAGRRSRLVVLVTSRHVPPPALLARHLHIEPLEPEAAFEQFVALIGHCPGLEEYHYVQQICAALGYLPLAIELAAAAATVGAMPLALLAAYVVERPLDLWPNGGDELRARFAGELERLSLDLRQQFALLSLLPAPSFGLESAAALSTEVRPPELLLPQDIPASELLRLPEHADISSDGASIVAPPLSRLASTAATMTQLMSHSLVSLAPPPARTTLPFLPGYQEESNTTRYYLHPLLRAHAEDTLHLLDPEIVGSARRNIQSYALAYVEHYQGDVARLEQERQFLQATLERAWQQKQYEQVLQLVLGLRPLMGLLGADKEGERLLSWGVEASQYLRDWYHTMRLSNHLGVLLYYRGDLARARRLFQQSLSLSESLNQPPTSTLWYPLNNLICITYMLSDYEAAYPLAETFRQHMQDIGDRTEVAAAHLWHGRLAYQRGNVDQAYDHLRECISLSTTSCEYDQFHRLRAQLHLALIEGDYGKADMYIEAISQTISQAYEIAELRWEQARHAAEHSTPDRAYPLLQRALELATQVGASHLRLRCLSLLEQLPDMQHSRAR